MDTPISTTMITADTLFSMPTCVGLFFPTSPDENGNERFTGLVDSESKEDLRFDIHEAEMWVKYRLGPCSRRTLTAGEMRHLQMCLDKGKTFRMKHLVGATLKVTQGTTTPNLSTVRTTRAARNTHLRNLRTRTRTSK